MFGFGRRQDGDEARFDFIYGAARAAAELYGVVTLADFAERVVGFWRPECREAAASPDIGGRLEARARAENAAFTVRDDEIVHVSIQDDWARQGTVRRLHIGRTPWLPKKESEFLSYGKSEDACCPGAKSFRNLFSKESGPLADESVVRALVDQCRQGCGDDGDLDMAVSMLAMVTGRDEGKIARALTELRNTSRVWALFGQTAEEAGISREVKARTGADDAGPASAASSGYASFVRAGVDLSKVGRNDPCPCGSGRKFKKCCGRG